MKLFLVLLYTVSYHYCYGYPVVDRESTEEQIRGLDDTFLKNILGTKTDTYPKDNLNQLWSNSQEMEFLVSDIKQQDLDTNEIRNLDTESGSIVNAIKQQAIDTNEIYNFDSELGFIVNKINQQDVDTNEISNLDSELGSIVNGKKQQDIDTNEIRNLDSELGSIVNKINQQDIDTNEILSLDSELGSIDDSDVVVLHIEYVVDSGSIATDSIEVEDASEVTAWGRWPWFFLALGVALLMKLVWYLCRKEQQYKRDNKWRIQLVGEK